MHFFFTISWCYIVIRAGLHPLDLDVGKWFRKHAPGIKPIVAMNKSESLCDGVGSISDAADEALMLGFGDPIAISAETGLGMAALHDALQPLIEDYMLQVLNSKITFLLYMLQDYSSPRIARFSVFFILSLLFSCTSYVIQ